MSISLILENGKPLGPWMGVHADKPTRRRKFIHDALVERGDVVEIKNDILLASQNDPLLNVGRGRLVLVVVPHHN